MKAGTTSPSAKTSPHNKRPIRRKL